jgi:hypothetical protein
MNPDQFREIVRRRPFRPVEVTTTSGDHYVLTNEGYFYNNPRRRPELVVLFTEDGLMHLLEAGRIVSLTIL